MGPAATSCDVLQFVAALISIRMNTALEIFKECHGMFCVSGWLIIIEDNRRPVIITGSVQPHIRFRLWLLTVLFQDLHRCLVTVDDIPLKEQLPEMLRNRDQVILCAADNPVRHSCPA